MKNGQNQLNEITGRTALRCRRNACLLLCCILLIDVIPAHAAGESSPLAQRISQAFVFPQPIVWVGETEPGEAESQALWEGVQILRSQGAEACVAALERFVKAHPQSAWAASLQSNLGKYHRDHGRYTPALQHWKAAWEATGKLSEARAKRVADYTFAHWTRLLASLGRKDMLLKLFEETKGRGFDGGPLQQIINGTRDGLVVMMRDPGVAYKCGPFALRQMMTALRQTNANWKVLADIPSPETGFSMTALLELSGKIGLDLTAAERPEGAALIVPSVVHWRQNHYAAIVGSKDGMFRVVDPTFGKEQWLSAAVIHAEASGRFLVPANALPQEWRRLARADTDQIFGKGYPNNIDDDGDENCTSCPCPAGSGGPSGSGSGPGAFGSGPGALGSGPGALGSGSGGCGGCGSGGGPSLAGEAKGMPSWRVSEPFITLWMHDEPLGYQPSRGARVSFLLSYKHRDTRVDDPRIFSAGLLWNFPWLSYVVELGPTQAKLYVAGGGERTYTSDGQTRHYWSNTLLQRLTNGGGNLTGYRLAHSDGSKDEYGHVVTGTTTNVFLTERSDAAGRKTRFDYDAATSPVRLKYVVDADGKTNSISYVASNAYSTNLIGQVTDAHGRTTTLEYDATGHLTNITDVANLTSAFKYNSEGAITNLTTPYGTTTFEYTAQSEPGVDLGGTNINRAILVTMPNNGKHLYAYRDNSVYLSATNLTELLPGSYSGDQVPTNTPVGTLDNVYMFFRNSFYWGPRQYAALSTSSMSNFTTNDYNKAHLKHWAHNPDYLDGLKVTHTLSLDREPCPDTTGNSYGQMTWYDYYGKVAAFTEGTNSLPGAIVRVLPDGNHWYEWNRRDEWCRATNVVTTYFSGTSVLTRTNTFLYSTNGVDLLERRGPLGELDAGYSYNTDHEVLTMTNAASEVTGYTYNTNQQLTSVKTAAGLTTTNLYGADGRLATTIALEINRTNSYTWANGQVFTHTDERGLRTTNSWDALQRLTNVAYPDGTSMKYRYDKLDLVEAVDRLGFTNSLAYNSVRLRTASTDALGRKTSYAYCNCGSLDYVTNALGQVTAFAYDNQGRRTIAFNPDGYNVTNVYNRIGQVTYTSDGQVAKNYIYNNQGLLVRVDSGVSYIWLLRTYDIEDHLVKEVDRNGVTNTMTYDALGRLASRTHADGGVERFAYSARGLTAHTNQLGHVTLFDYDVAGRKVGERNANNALTEFYYDATGNLTFLLDAEEDGTWWSYDEFGRATNKLVGYSQEIFRYHYDPNGRLTNRWSAAKGGTTYRYDAAGNLTNVVYPVSTNLVLNYDGLNRLTNLVDAVGTNAYTYDAAGQLLSEDGPWSSDTVSYTYTNRLRKSLSLLQPGAAAWTQSYTHDALRYLASVSSPAGVFNYGYVLGSFASSLVDGMELPGGATIANSYDVVKGRLTETTLLNAQSTALNSHAYGYNLLDQRTNTTRLDAPLIEVYSTVDYTYDAIGQLTAAVGSDNDDTRLHEQMGYAYDAVGNLAVRTNNALVQTFAVNYLNELTSLTRDGTLTVAGAAAGAPSWEVTNMTVNGVATASYYSLYLDGTFAVDGFPLVNGTTNFTAIAKNERGQNATNTVSVNLAATVSFTYDANGNLVSDGKRGLDYDDENQLTRVTVTNAWKSEFVYDGLMRRRIQRDYGWNGGAWVKTNEIRYVYDGNLPIQHRDANNLPVLTLTRGLDLSGTLASAGGIGGLLAMTESSGQHSYYHADGNGNVTCLINTDQLIVAKYLYDPFGRTLAMSGPKAAVNLYRFSSKPIHELSGMYDYLYRWYVPELQRWISRDPLQEWWDLNLFRFANNSPIDTFDIYGLASGSPFKAPIKPPGGIKPSWFTSFKPPPTPATIGMWTGFGAGLIASGGAIIASYCDDWFPPCDPSGSSACKTCCYTTLAISATATVATGAVGCAGTFGIGCIFSAITTAASLVGTGVALSDCLDDCKPKSP